MLGLEMLATDIETGQEGSKSQTPLIFTVAACVARKSFDVAFVAVDKLLVIVGHRRSAVVAARASRPFHLVVDEPDGCLTVVIHVLAAD